MELNRPQLNYSGEDWMAMEAWLNTELLDTYKRLASLTISDQETHQLKGRASLLTAMLGFRTLHAAFRPQNRS